MLTGGVVRVTGSGLGCPTWPSCEAGSLTTTPELGIHGFIEFANRALTGILIFAVAWAIVAARLQAIRIRTLTRLAWSQFWLVIANSVAGGITVLTGLNPYVVALHFIMAMALLTTTTLTWHRARQWIASSASTSSTVAANTVDAAPPRRLAVQLSTALVIVTFVLIVLGTLVTGSGEHSGDTEVSHRMVFVWGQVVIAHSVIGSAVIVLAVALLFSLRGTRGTRLARTRVIGFLVITVAQALLGVIQAIHGSPAWMVAIHVFGSALVWVGALRVLLDVNTNLFAPADSHIAPVELLSSGIPGQTAGLSVVRKR